MVYKSVDHGKDWSICFFLLQYYKHEKFLVEFPLFSVAKLSKQKCVCALRCKLHHFHYILIDHSPINQSAHKKISDSFCKIKCKNLMSQIGSIYAAPSSLAFVSRTAAGN